MSNLVDSLGVMFHRAGNYHETTFVVSESELESALDKLILVNSVDKVLWSEGLTSEDRFAARLLYIEEIKREPVKVVVTDRQLQEAFDKAKDAFPLMSDERAKALFNTIKTELFKEKVR